MDLASQISVAVGHSQGRARILAGFAYANLAGVNALRGSLSSHEWWRDVDCRWIFGIANGVTEPRAIKALLGETGQQVRLFVPRGRLEYDSLTRPPRFHAKVISVEAGRPPRPRLFWAASANATSAALAEHSVNFEAGLSLVGRFALPLSETRVFHRWWNDAWNSSIRVTESVLRDYSRLRLRYRRQNPTILETVEPPAIPDVEQSSDLWFESGAMSGGARNQIEFSEELTSFFSPPRNRRINIEIEHDNQIDTGRPLTPKTTTYGVRIWRLGLPTGVDYAHKVIHLRRLPIAAGGAPRFKLEVDEADGRLSRRWYALANSSGYVGATRSAGGKDSRQYGLF